MNNDATPAFPWHRDGQAAPKVPTLKQNARRFSSSMTMRMSDPRFASSTCRQASMRSVLRQSVNRWTSL